jgi:hypothetical protein
MNWKLIIEGWRNHLFPPEELREIINELSAQRLAHCRVCPHNSTPGEIHLTSRCTKCGCFLIAKSKALDSVCPDDPPQWGAVASPEDDEAFRKSL